MVNTFWAARTNDSSAVLFPSLDAFSSSLNWILSFSICSAVLFIGGSSNSGSTGGLLLASILPSGMFWWALGILGPVQGNSSPWASSRCFYWPILDIVKEHLIGSPPHLLPKNKQYVISCTTSTKISVSEWSGEGKLEKYGGNYCLWVAIVSSGGEL